MGSFPTFRVTVSVELGGQRLDRALPELLRNFHEDLSDAAEFVTLSRSRIQKLIEDGFVCVNGVIVNRSSKVQPGQVIDVILPEPEPLELIPEAMDLNVLYEDSQIIVVNKPAGLVVHPGAGHRTGTLVHGLLAHCVDLSGIGGKLRPGIVHRLDRYTSGVILAAKTDRAHESMAKQFAERKIKKDYKAFVFGVPSPLRDVIDTFFGRHPTGRTRFSSKVNRGKRAVTSYAVVESSGGLSRLAIRLGTGRTHQIRVHLADRGHPVVGDKLYGGLTLKKIDDEHLQEAVRRLEGHALHAEKLEFYHPLSGDLVIVEADLPDELAELEFRMQAEGIRS